MSWEVMWTKRYVCPCGNGEFVEETLSDDWGRFQQTNRMECPQCRKNYVLSSFSYTHKGMTNRSNYWILKVEQEKIEDMKSQIVLLKKEIDDVAVSRYKKPWLGLFENAKSKKKIHEMLSGMDSQSLSTFYNRARYSPVEDLLLGYLNWYDLEKVLNKLGAQDKELIDKLAEIRNLEKKIDEIEHSAIQKSKFIEVK